MAQFYTKQQTDELATIIGQRINTASSTASVTSALLNSSEYALLTKSESEALKAIKPAQNIASFLDALDNGYTPPAEESAQYITLAIPTQGGTEMSPETSM